MTGEELLLLAQNLARAFVHRHDIPFNDFPDYHSVSAEAIWTASRSHDQSKGMAKDRYLRVRAWQRMQDYRRCSLGLRRKVRPPRFICTGDLDDIEDGSYTRERREDVERRDELERLLRISGAGPDDRRLLREFSRGRSGVQIARDLGCSETLVVIRRKRILARLRKFAGVGGQAGEALGGGQRQA